MFSRFANWNVLVASLFIISNHVESFPQQTRQNGYDQLLLDQNEQMAQLNRQLSLADTEARISRVFYMKNSSYVHGTTSQMVKDLFGLFMNATGISRMAEVISMSWIEISSIRGEYTNPNEIISKCNEVLHPDHLLSNVILENLIPRKIMVIDETMDNHVRKELLQLFCSEDMKLLTLYHMQTDDVISGLVILAERRNGDILYLANVGF